MKKIQRILQLLMSMTLAKVDADIETVKLDDIVDRFVFLKY